MMDRRFDTLPMSYAQLLPSLQQLQLVQLCTLAPPVGRLPVGYDANARCSFHSGAPGHNIENCKAFKHVVQDLIDSKAINFAPAPNVVNNPMPQHRGANVNMVEGEVKLVSAVNNEDGDSDCDIDNWVRPRIPGEVLNNWSSEEIVQATCLEE